MRTGKLRSDRNAAEHVQEHGDQHIDADEHMNVDERGLRVDEQEASELDQAPCEQRPRRG